MGIDFAGLLKEGARELGVELNGGQVGQFSAFKDILLEWNEKMNLTAVTDEAGFLVKHFFDSLSIERHIPVGAAVADVGTGAGFPGVPLLIARPDCRVTLMDSLKKRLTFLGDALGRLGIEYAGLVHSRAEDAGREDIHREKYGVTVSRAVADLALLSELSLPLVKAGGLFIAMKGPNAADEISRAMDTIIKLGGELSLVDRLVLPGAEIMGEEIERTILIIRKIRQTPIKYPRTSAELSRIYKKKG
ncbi:MAG: 16S rRNA (guanine(527)-N(7))-methyltransferase RsmG [Defluviitaleaceae bacterium]|nr:16S rRNA (guanine(527)-N(7))-methyltransferase RsmG [Defluviitaleaceae bacterium]MCL2835942.1 16S rRNA (guanine(527)-N(7))-methyltransferase RsmG [Defluviitaleaceae bacterium]